MERHSTKTPRFTAAEYLQLEADAIDKHEYRDGEIIAMAGGSPQHSLIIANLIREVGIRLKGSDCRVYESNLRVRSNRAGLYTYPDLSVVCGTLKYDPLDKKRTTIVNPRVIIEVLSPTTETYDRGEKFGRYFSIETFEEYILVSQTIPRVEMFLRKGEGEWLFTHAVGTESSARFRSLGVEVPLSEIYAGIVFPPEPERKID